MLPPRWGGGTGHGDTLASPLASPQGRGGAVVPTCSLPGGGGGTGQRGGGYLSFTCPLAYPHRPSLYCIVGTDLVRLWSVRENSIYTGSRRTVSSPSRVIATRLFFNDLRPYFRPCMPLAAVGFRLTVEPPGALARRAPLLRDPVHHLPSICLRSLILGALQLIRHLHGGGRAGSKIHVGRRSSLVASLFGELCVFLSRPPSLVGAATSALPIPSPPSPNPMDNV